MKAARTAWRQAQIIEAAIRLLETQGFHQMTIGMLAEEAGVSVGTIYQYVDGKEDILVLVILDILDAYGEAIPAAAAAAEDPVERLTLAFRAYCEVVESRRSAVVLGYGESRTLDPERRKQVMRRETETTVLFADLLAQGVAAGVFVEHDTVLLAFDMAMLAHAWALKHWHFARIMDLDEYVEAQLRTVLRSIACPELVSAYDHVPPGDNRRTARPSRDRR